MPIVGPWFLSASAVRDFCRLHNANPDDGATFDRMAKELGELTELAKHVRSQDNGLDLYRLRGGRQHYGYRFLVSTQKRKEGDAPQLVKVLPEHSGGRRRG